MAIALARKKFANRCPGLMMRLPAKGGHKLNINIQLEKRLLISNRAFVCPPSFNGILIKKLKVRPPEKT